MDEYTIYWWTITGADSDLCGEMFFTELDGEADTLDHLSYAKEIFPNEKLHCFGQITAEEADYMGYDTY